MGTNPGVIIPAIDTASSTAAVRSLGRQSFRTVVISEHDTPPAVRSKYCDESLSVPDPSQDMPGYAQALLSLARREDIVTILPFREMDIYTLARNKEAFAEYIGTPFPPLETLNQVQDRIQLRDAAIAADVAMPRTATVSEWGSWDEPSIIKPRYTVHAPEYAARFDEPRPERGSTRYVARGTQPDREALVAELGHEPIVQEYVPTTDEYGFFALYDHGSPVATFQHRQIRGWKYEGGPSAYRKSVSIPALEEAGRALLDELDWHGVAMVEFLRDPNTGVFKLMEINPRFWSSLPFTIQAGVDFPGLYVSQATKSAPTRANQSPAIATDGTGSHPEYEVDIGGHLLWGELLHLHSILSEGSELVEKPSFGGTLGEIGHTILTESRFDYLSRDDPGPFIQDLRRKFTSILRGTSSD